MNYDSIRWENWHKHTHYSNIMTADSIIKIEDVAKRAVELGHKTITTVEHGFAGNVFEYYDVAEKYGLKMVFGVEFYFVNDRHDRDRTNAHLLILAKNNEGKRQLTELISESNLTGYYYRPRIDRELLFSLNKDDVVVTSACVQSPYNLYDDESFITDCLEHFGENFYLEIQANLHEKQVNFNKKLLKMHEKYDIPLVFGADSHYILEEDAELRDTFLKGKGVFYGDSDGSFIADYPDTETVFNRFRKQGVFTDEQVLSALENTLAVEDFGDIEMDKEIKMPSINPELSHKEKIEKLKDIINKEWIEDRKHIPKEKHGEYIEAIKFEMDIIEKTGTEDYFLLNYPVIQRAKELGGVLTRTGRGCFTKDSLVHTKDGVKPINEVEAGDYVINMYGEYDKVVKTWEYDVHEELLQIKHSSNINENNPVVCTKDHKILIYREGKVEYIQAENIKKDDYVCCPKNSMDLHDSVVPIGRYLEDDDYFYLPIDSVESVGVQKTKVYDLQVKNNPSFLLNNMIVHNSAPSYFLNKLLGFTEVDRLDAPITLYPTRFMSISRILETKSLPDILNVAYTSDCIVNNLVNSIA